jgi:hypothetical protein
MCSRRQFILPPVENVDKTLTNAILSPDGKQSIKIDDMRRGFIEVRSPVAPVSLASDPAIIQVAAYTDFGATIAGPQADLNLGITTYVKGAPMNPISSTRPKPQPTPSTTSPPTAEFARRPFVPTPAPAACVSENDQTK